MNVLSSGARTHRRRSRTLSAVLAPLVVVCVAAYLVVVAGPAAHAAPTLLSQGRPTTASSLENASFPASNATDGNPATRWSSAFADPQWIQVDLGATATISSVTLSWEAAFGRAFQLQTSTDGTTWTTIFATTTGTGGVQNLTVSGTGRFVRMNGTARGTQFGYSLFEFQVFGTGGGTPPPTSSGSGEPPESFWGDPSTVPAAHNVLEVRIENQTNGQYPDSQVFWTFNGQTASIAQQPFIDMPANSAGRLTFHLGTPDSQFSDFIEFTVGPTSINVDTTRVDRFGLPLALRVHGHDGGNHDIGDSFTVFSEPRTTTFQRFSAFVPAEFQELATDQAPFGIPSPGNDRAFQPGGQFANYFTAYAASVGDTADTTAQVFGCAGTLAANPTLCAGLNRHVAQLPVAQQNDPGQYYLAAPANYYAEFWHQNSIGGKQYGFPYDDVDQQSSDISVANPQYMVVAVGY